MTSTGTDRHPETTEIAAFAEGLLSPSDTADIGDHLEGCARCAGVRDALTELRDLLGDLPAPPPMPEAAARRIDAALADEARQRAAGTGPYATPPHSGADSVRDASQAEQSTADTPAHVPAARSERGHVSRETSPAPDRPAGRSSGGTGPGRGARSGRRWRRLAAAAATVAVLGGGGRLVHGLIGGPHTPPNAGPQHVTTVLTFSGTALPDKVHDLLAAATPKARPNISPGGENSPMATQPPAVPGCVMRATSDPGGLPLASARGTYDGRSAYLVVLPDPAAPRERVDAYVVDAACTVPGSAASGQDGHLLARETYPRT